MTMPQPPLVAYSNLRGAREIALSRGMVALVDDEDFARLSQWTWAAGIANRGNMYALRTDWPSRRTVLMHREILGAAKGEYVDHINGNRLDNRRANLRLCTHQQNLWNQSARSRKGPGSFKGVYPQRSKWRAVCAEVYLGVFDTQEEAARAFDDAARQLHGEFARLNFPLPGEQPAIARAA